MKKDKDYKFLVYLDTIINDKLISGNLLICDTKSQAVSLIKDFYKFLDTLHKKCPKYFEGLYDRDFNDEDKRILKQKDKILNSVVWPMNIDFSMFFDSCSNDIFYKDSLHFIKIPYIANEK